MRINGTEYHLHATAACSTFRIEEMNWRDFAALPDHRCQRNTEAHLRRAKHLQQSQLGAAAYQEGVLRLLTCVRHYVEGVPFKSRPLRVAKQDIAALRRHVRCTVPDGTSLLRFKHNAGPAQRLGG